MERLFRTQGNRISGQEVSVSLKRSLKTNDIISFSVVVLRAKTIECFVHLIEVRRHTSAFTLYVLRLFNFENYDLKINISERLTRYLF